ncbi:MAG: LamG domain-containing protein [Ferruginibacter sp.]
MRTSKFNIYLFAITVSLGMIASCSKKESTPDYNSNKTALKAAIDSLTIVYNSTVDGTKPGQYVIGSRAALDSVIQLATQVYTGATFTQEHVNNALRNLLANAQIFRTKLLQEVSVANLMAFWKFNGNPADSSGNGHNGMLKTGLLGSSATTAVDGGTLPVLVPDRFGRPNMAYDFNNAATVEIPYAAALNPQNITICVWIKRHNTNSNNYILSLNRWNGFKFQLQSNNFLFFTFHDANNGYHDVDDNPGTIPQDIWTHAVLSYTNGTMKFYINGALQKTAAVSGVPITVAPPVNLSIGNEMPASAYNLTDSNSPNYFYGASFFIGSLDDMRFYNTALSDAEVLSIYTQEKSL